MKICNHDPRPLTVPLCRIRQQTDRYPSQCFKFEGHVYALFGNVESLYLTVQFDSTCLLAFNLRSRTIRGIANNEPVLPVEAEVHVYGLHQDVCRDPYQPKTKYTEHSPAHVP